MPPPKQNYRPRARLGRANQAAGRATYSPQLHRPSFARILREFLPCKCLEIARHLLLWWARNLAIDYRLAECRRPRTGSDTQSRAGAERHSLRRAIPAANSPNPGVSALEWNSAGPV